MLHQRPLIIICVLICCIFLTGCVSLQSTRNQTSFTQTSKTPQIIGPTGTPCPPTNETPYIIINPISTHNVGDVFEINGTTNLGIDKKLKMDIGEARMTGVGPYDMPDRNYSYTDSQGYAKLNGGDCGINSWSYQVNLTGFHDRTGYGVNAYSEQNRMIINYSYFIVRRSD